MLQINVVCWLDNADVLKYGPFVVIALVFGRGLFNFMSSYCLSYVGSQVVRSLRQQLFEHILHLPVSEYGNFSALYADELICEDQAIDGARARLDAQNPYRHLFRVPSRSQAPA